MRRFRNIILKMVRATSNSVTNIRSVSFVSYYYAVNDILLVWLESTAVGFVEIRWRCILGRLEMRSTIFSRLNRCCRNPIDCARTVKFVFVDGQYVRCCTDDARRSKYLTDQFIVKDVCRHLDVSRRGSCYWPSVYRDRLSWNEGLNITNLCVIISFDPIFAVFRRSSTRERKA